MSPSRAARAVAVALTAGSLVACDPDAVADDARPLVVASIFPVADLLARLGGDRIRVDALLPPLASPATWEATPAQVRAAARAVGLVVVGGGLDAWVEELAPAPDRLPRLRLTDGIELVDAEAEERAHGHGEGGDPHVWLDPILVRDRILPSMTAFLVELVPDDDAVERQARALADSLTALDGWIRARLAPAPSRDFVVTHGAWTYFAARYDLRALGSLYPRPGHEPSARGLAALVLAARRAGVRAVLTEPQLAGGGALALARELRADAIVVDPLGGPGVPEREGYFEMMRFNGRAFASALERGGP